jgi:hypothetical protein
MGVRQELRMLDTLLEDIARYQKGLIGFEKLNLTLRSVAEAIDYLGKGIKTELMAYANSFEAIGIYPKSDYKHIVQRQEDVLLLPTDEQESVNNALSEVSMFLTRVKNQTTLMYCCCCGYDLSDLLLRIKGDSSQKCPCCGIPIESPSLSDQEVMRYRDRWLEHPTYWYDSAVCPKDWDIGEQLQHMSTD